MTIPIILNFGWVGIMLMLRKLCWPQWGRAARGGGEGEARVTDCHRAVESPAGGRGGPSESDRLGEVRLIHAPAAQASALGSRPLDFRP